MACNRPPPLPQWWVFPQPYPLLRLHIITNIRLYLATSFRTPNCKCFWKWKCRQLTGCWKCTEGAKGHPLSNGKPWNGPSGFRRTRKWRIFVFFRLLWKVEDNLTMLKTEILDTRYVIQAPLMCQGASCTYLRYHLEINPAWPQKFCYCVVGLSHNFWMIIPYVVLTSWPVFFGYHSV